MDKYLKYFSMYSYLNTFIFKKYLYLNTFQCILPHVWMGQTQNGCGFRQVYSLHLIKHNRQGFSS